MPSLLLPQIQALMSDLSERLEMAWSTDELPFFAHLKWWLADGAFNFAPQNMFQTEMPYQGENDVRTVREFLEQTPHIRWEGMHTLRDLFSEEAMTLLTDWAHAMLRERMGEGFPSEDEWEQVYVDQWEQVLWLTGLHPKSAQGAWDELLDIKLSVLVEPMRFSAAQVSRQRRAKVALAVSKHDLEEAMIQAIASMIDQARADKPANQSWAVWLMGLLEAQQVRLPLEVALYANSSRLSRLIRPDEIKQFTDRFPIPPAWMPGKKQASLTSHW